VEIGGAALTKKYFTIEVVFDDGETLGFYKSEKRMKDAEPEGRFVDRR